MPDPPPSPHPLSYAQPDARRSSFGVISLVCGLIAVLSVCLSAEDPRQQSTPGPSLPMTQFIGTLIFAAIVAVLLVGIGSGILGVLPSRRKRALALVGLILNGLAALLILVLTIANLIWSI